MVEKKVVETWKCSDGREFQDEGEALHYENLIPIRDDIAEFSKSASRGGRGSSYKESADNLLKRYSVTLLPGFYLQPYTP